MSRRRVGNISQRHFDRLLEEEVHIIEREIELVGEGEEGFNDGILEEEFEIDEVANVSLGRNIVGDPLLDPPIPLVLNDVHYDEVVGAEEDYGDPLGDPLNPLVLDAVHYDEVVGPEEDYDSGEEDETDHFFSGSDYDSDDGNESEFDFDPEGPGDPDVNEIDPEVEQPSLKSKLAQFIRKNCLSREATRELLIILREEGLDLPLTRETLLRTPRRSIVPRECWPGEYCHFGVSKNLKRLNFVSLANLNSIRLDVSIDGLSLSKSSKLKIWPILVAFPDVPSLSPILVGAYVGYHDPRCINDFLFEFVEEMQTILQNGAQITPQLIRKPIAIRGFICDSPARSFLCGVLGHQSNFGCSKCHQRCVRILGRKTYLTVRGEARTDASFSNRTHLIHHKPQFQGEQTLLETLNVGMVTQVPLDPMHLLDEGVMARMLQSIFFKGTCASAQLRNGAKELVDTINMSLAAYIPAEFERQPRSILQELSRWKASEFRLFLNYTGCVVLKDYLGPDLYNHFLLLFTAIRFLACPATHLVNADVSQRLLEEFVADYPRIYNPTEVVSNVHGLLHIVDDVRQFGPLYSFSAYKYENHMREVRKLVKKPNRVLQQIHNRLEEIEFINDTNRNVGFVGNPQPYDNDIFPGCNSSYRAFQFDSFILKSNLRDSCCMLHSGIPIIVERFALYNDERVVFARHFFNIRDFFEAPVQSGRYLGIILVDNITSEQLFMHNINEVAYKLVRLPYHEHFVLQPMLHHVIN